MNFLDQIFGVAFSVIRLFILSVLGTDAPYQFNEDVTPDRTYDFVVVGSGAGGSVVASRLSETGASVLVLEAGGNAPTESAIPGLSGFWDEEESGWILQAERDFKTPGLENEEILYSGKAMGGSTSINGMTYVRGSKRDWDSWANEGLEDWNYQSMLPYMKKIENYKGIKTAFSDSHRGQGGPITLKNPDTSLPMTKSFLKAGKELGYSFIDDAGPRPLGFFPFTTNVKNGIRQSASEAYLRPNIHKKNLFVLARAEVTRIIFNDEKVAVAVEFVFKGQRRIVLANKEVILSCGTFATPKLLMLSGLGPADHLQEIGIPVVADIPGVGQNLQDRPYTALLPFLTKKDVGFDLFDLYSPKSLKQAIFKRSGPLSYPSFPSGHAFLDVGYGDSQTPDVHIQILAFNMAMDFGLISRNAYTKFKKEVFKELHGPLLGKEGIMFIVTPCKVKSRGYVKLRSANYKDSQIINNKLFDHPEDSEKILKGIRKVFELVNTKTLQEDLNARFVSNKISLCKQHNTFESYWSCFMKNCFRDGIHTAGTAKMAPITDPMGVVDPRLKVRGVERLRVVDASVMPFLSSGNLMSSILSVAEKASDLIKQDWGYI